MVHSSKRLKAWWEGKRRELRDSSEERRCHAFLDDLFKKKTQRIGRQHYVPQAYLRWFSSDGKNLWAYDKLAKKSFGANILNLAQENGFYELHFDVSSNPLMAKFKIYYIGPALNPKQVSKDSLDVTV